MIGMTRFTMNQGDDLMESKQQQFGFNGVEWDVTMTDDFQYDLLSPLNNRNHYMFVAKQMQGKPSNKITYINIYHVEVYRGYTRQSEGLEHTSNMCLVHSNILPSDNLT